ncbi:GNAT family N-acetyltransferase [Streptomyces pathocidini]|uniref:GNAT family N-acetyltransferase n=1 Tax=Streptomyces pathocidini TaxID=1650571 RepID=UPI0033E82AF2
MEIFLETERMVLRPFATTDIDRLVELDSDPEVMRFINGGRPTPHDEIRTRILPRFLQHHPTIGTFGYWAAETIDHRTFLGWFEFRPLDGESTAVELGYRLRRPAWGRGYATEGARALIRKGFTELGVQRVIARTMSVNAASRHVMEKAGLTHVRTYSEDWPDPIPGSEQGELEYALTKADWQG